VDREPTVADKDQTWWRPEHVQLSCNITLQQEGYAGWHLQGCHAAAILQLRREQEGREEVGCRHVHKPKHLHQI
jgi:hypothetical protein